MINQDKPLYFQGKWWFISEDREYFWIDPWPHDLSAPRQYYLPNGLNKRLMLDES